MAVAGSLDHLRTWYQLVAGDLKLFPLPIFSPYTLARGAYEPALLALWLLDPDVDSAERIGRGYAAQLRSLDVPRLARISGLSPRTLQSRPPSS